MAAAGPRRPGAPVGFATTTQRATAGAGRRRLGSLASGGAVLPGKGRGPRRRRVSVNTGFGAWELVRLRLGFQPLQHERDGRAAHDHREPEVREDREAQRDERKPGETFEVGDGIHGGGSADHSAKNPDDGSAKHGEADDFESLADGPGIGDGGSVGRRVVLRTRRPPGEDAGGEGGKQQGLPPAHGG